jgi:hypothetical protein
MLPLTHNSGPTESGAGSYRVAESGVAMGMSAAFYERVQIREGGVHATNDDEDSWTGRAIQ